MVNLIQQIHKTLNMMKDFLAAYSSETIHAGKMLIEYQGKRYFVQFTEVQSPSDNIFKDIDRLKWV